MMIEDVLEMRPSIPSTQNNTPSHQNSYSFSTLTIITGKGRRFGHRDRVETYIKAE